MKLFVIFSAILLSVNTFAQLPSKADNTEYGIAQMMDAKAKKYRLGPIHSESTIMRPTAGKGGYFLRYEGGWVYFNPKVNHAFAIWGEMMKKWSEAGYETGWLGFPITDLTPTPSRQGFFVAFDNGSIYQSPINGTHFVAGSFRDEWAKRGWENSATLGFPTTDEVQINMNGYTRYQQFEKGTLFFGNGNDVLYSNNPNATSPPAIQNYQLTFTPNYTSGGEPGSDLDGIDLYGWMDIRVYKANGKEISDADGKSFSLFNIPKDKYMADEGFKTHLGFIPTNRNFIRNYAVTQTDIDENAFVRIIYWLNDFDKSSSNDYLKLKRATGSIAYNNGNHPYIDIKLQEIVKYNNKTTRNDDLSDGSGDSYRVGYILSLSKK